MDTSRISPTAHYTGYLWCHHGLSPPELATATGRAMFQALKLPMRAAARTAGGTTLDRILLQRHGLIDHLLERAIEDGRIGQVIEIAAGLSGRGYRFKRRYPDLRYVEGDLPDMVVDKRALLARLPHARGHYVVALNALIDEGDDSLGSVAERLLERERGTALITEGLLSYFSTEDVTAMFRRFASCLSGFANGLYLSDIHPKDELHSRAAVRAFRRLLSAFARGPITLHFDTPESATEAVRHAGFTSAAVHRSADHPSLGLPGPSAAYVIAGVR